MHAFTRGDMTKQMLALRFANLPEIVLIFMEKVDDLHYVLYAKGDKKCSLRPYSVASCHKMD